MSGNRLVRLLLLLVNLVLILGLGASIVAPYIAPYYFMLPSFFGLAFVPILIINILILVFWLLLRPKYAWFSGIAILAATPNLLNHFGFNGSASEGNLKVMSYNVRLFDLYNWSGHNEATQNFSSFFNRHEADIYCFQEYFNSERMPNVNTQDAIAQNLSPIERHEYFTAELHDKKHRFGIATYSKYPIIKKGLVPLDTADHNVAIYTDLLIDRDTVRVFNMHLASVHLSEMEKDIDEHIMRNNQLQQWQDLKRLIKRLAGGYKKRALQADHIADYISESPHPVIVCGDFNDTPGSYAYRTLRGDLTDAFTDCGLGFGTSYVGYFPSLRIDYILHSPSITTHEFETIDERMSDHRPLLANLSLN